MRQLVRSGAASAAGTGRVVRYVFSTSAVARDNHTISNTGWDLTNFLKNPVFLWAHDSGAPPIGRVVDIAATARGLVGSVEYADPDIYPFADTVYRLVKGGFVNATSVSWNPIEYRWSTDKNRPGGIDFLKQELLEVSQVPVPALPEALVEARRRGIDTGPIASWAERRLDKGVATVSARLQLEKLAKVARTPAASRPHKIETAEDCRRQAAAIKSRVEKTFREYDAKLARIEEEQAQRRFYEARTSTLQGRIDLANEYRRKCT
jgi:HK97 family phage prohead protease